MKKVYIFLPLILVFIISCMTNESDSDRKAEQPDRDDTLIAADTGLYFTARGNEPGWYVEISRQSAGQFSYSLKLNYGTETYSGPAVEAGQDGSKFILENDSVDLELQITDEPCTDAAGRNFAGSAVIKKGDQEYRGCGEFAGQEDSK